ncbi:PAS domain-containing protein [Halovenus aranensis]|uniref:PAS domain-containing protein n=1 Tax=Halovenus aranensis TaxID=890420 RepID=A0A1G8URR2_9EURY|nr:histidine kinase N-terminal 7TM domain-containing protein [Halovenus aranensis]SDJ56247.1 PAS domain-containing protein [Halovenus aranensis]
MGWTVSVVSAVVLTAGVLCAGIGIVALQKRPDPVATPLAALMFFGTLWTIPEAISLGFDTLDQILFWNKLLFPGASLVPVAYFVLGLRYAGYDRWRSWTFYGGLCVIPVVTVLGALTNDVHGLFWESVAIEQVAGVTTLAGANGPLLWLNLGYSYLLIVVAWAIFAGVALRSRPLYRRQALLMLVGGVAPTVLNVMFNLGVGPLPALDLTSSSLALSGTAFALALFRYELIGLTPAAYRSVPDLFADGVLVFDDDRRVVEANEHAERILDTDITAGTAATDLFDSPLRSLDGTVLTVDKPNPRMYTVRYSVLCDQRDDPAGHAVVMREVTELKEHQQRLSVTNRVLRHNLRNELNIVLGVADQLEGADLDERARKSLDRLQAAAGRLNDVSEKARHIQASLRIDQEALLAIDLVVTVETVIDRYRTEFPEAEIRYEGPDRLLVRAAGRDTLETVVRNVIENALEHNDNEQPTVEVAVSDRGDEAVLTVADDGPGIPVDEVEILDETVESQLEHGSSLGLWLTHWLVTAMDGRIEFASNEPRGSVVTVRLQTADETVSANRPRRRAGADDD